MGNSLLAVRGINHKYIVVGKEKLVKQNIEFERCIDFLVRMLDKYGEELLRELEEDKENNGQEKEENEKEKEAVAS